MNRNGASPLLSPLIKNHLSHLTTQLHATWFSNCRHGLPEVLFRTLLNFILTPPITSLKPKTRFSLKYSCQLYFIPKCMPNRFIESLVASNCRCWSRIFTFCIWEFFSPVGQFIRQMAPRNSKHAFPGSRHIPSFQILEFVSNPIPILSQCPASTVQLISSHFFTLTLSI